MPSKVNDSLENSTLDDDVNPAKRMKVNPANDHSVLELFVVDPEVPWQKNEIKNLGEWLKSRDIDIDNPAWFLQFSWEFGTADEKATKEDIFKVRATRELENILPFLLNCNDDVNFTNEYGQTILHVYLANIESNCEYYNDIVKVSDIVESLIEKGASVNAVDMRGKTPLHVAAENNKLDVLKVMLDSFRNFEACDEKGNTVLHIVVERYSDDDSLCLKIIRALLKKGADPNKKNEAGMTPLQLAVRKYNVDLLQIFQESNGDFSVLTNDNENLLLLAYKCCNFRIPEPTMEEIVDFLVNESCDVNIRNKFGYSPVHYAVKWGTALKPLIELGAEVNGQTTIKRKTPLHIAADMNRSECETIPMLFRAGADGDALDFEGRTALDIALENDTRTAKRILEFSGNIGNHITSNILTQCKLCAQTVFIDHMEKLREVGLPIDEGFQPYVDNNKKMWRRYHARQKEEVKRLMSYVISPGVSVYQFLHMNAKHQLAYVDCLPQDLESRFPWYASIILAVRREAVRRNQLLEPARAAWFQVTKVDLTSVCLERVLHFLNNWHLKVLIEAAEAKVE